MADSPNNSTSRLRPLARPFMGPGKAGVNQGLASRLPAAKAGSGLFAPRTRSDDQAAIPSPISAVESEALDRRGVEPNAYADEGAAAPSLVATVSSDLVVSALVMPGPQPGEERPDAFAARAIAVQLDAVLDPALEPTASAGVENGEIDELSLSPQSQWTTPSLEVLPSFGDAAESNAAASAAAEYEAVAPSHFAPDEVPLTDALGHALPQESELEAPPVMASAEEWRGSSEEQGGAASSVVRNDAYPITAGEASWSEPAAADPRPDAGDALSDGQSSEFEGETEPEVELRQPDSALGAFDDVASVEPVAMLTALLGEEREDPARERIALVLERLAARVRSGEISLGHSANVASETAVLASVLTTLLSEAL